LTPLSHLWDTSGKSHNHSLVFSLEPLYSFYTIILYKCILCYVLLLRTALTNSIVSTGVAPWEGSHHNTLLKLATRHILQHPKWLYFKDTYENAVSCDDQTVQPLSGPSYAPSTSHPLFARSLAYIPCHTCQELVPCTLLADLHMMLFITQE
jgi:hypothetical protein